jgi:hypothetical protein
METYGVTATVGIEKAVGVGLEPDRLAKRLSAHIIRPRISVWHYMRTVTIDKEKAIGVA